MEQPYDIPKDTREFLAQWNAATEEHLTAKLARILELLGRHEPLAEEVPMELYETLAPYVLRALQVAATPGSTVHDAVDQLEAAADTPA